VILEANHVEIGTPKQLKDALGKNADPPCCWCNDDGTLYLAIEKDS
jgi:hypothetical protein